MACGAKAIRAWRLRHKETSPPERENPVEARNDMSAQGLDRCSFEMVALSSNDFVCGAAQPVVYNSTDY